MLTDTAVAQLADKILQQADQSSRQLRSAGVAFRDLLVTGKYVIPEETDALVRSPTSIQDAIAAASAVPPG